MTIGSWVNGRYLDWEYRRVERVNLMEEKGPEDQVTFPIEQARYAGVAF